MIEFICEGENCGKVVTVKRVASLTHRFCKTCYKKNWKHSNPDKVKAAGKRYRDGEAGQASSKAYYQANSEKIIKNSAKSTKKKRDADLVAFNAQMCAYQKDFWNKNVDNPLVKLRVYSRNRLRMALKNNQKRGSAVKDLGCSVGYLKEYLEAKFKPGMTWENWGRGQDCWHIDHIIPLASFNLVNRSELLRAVHYTNLQPLWESDNLRKSDKVE